MLPNAAFVRARLVRAAGTWLGVRALVGATLLVARQNPLQLRFAASVEVLVICAVAAMAEDAWMGERIFVANLGVSRVACAVLDLMPAALGELLVRTAFGRPA